MSIQPQPLWKVSDTFTRDAARRVPQAQATGLVSKATSTEELLLPRSIGGVFDLAFDLYRVHFRTFVMQLAVLLLPVQAVLYLLFNVWLKPLNSYVDAHADNFGAGFLLVVGGMLTGAPLGGVPGLLSLLVLAIVSAPVTIALADIYHGRAPSWADSYRRAFRSIPRIILGWSIVGLVFVAVFAIAFMVGFLVLILASLVLSNTAPVLLGFCFILLLIIFPYVMSMTVIAFYFTFTTPLLLLEDVPLTAIPTRNWQLIGKARARRTWAAIVFLPIVFFTVQMLMLLSAGSCLSLFSLPAPMQFCIETLFTVLLIGFLQPYLLLFLNVLYFDFRIQRDGLDVRLLADDLPPVLLPTLFADQYPMSAPNTAASPAPNSRSMPVPSSPSPPSTILPPAAPTGIFDWSSHVMAEPTATPTIQTTPQAGSVPAAYVPHMDFTTPPDSSEQEESA